MEEKLGNLEILKEHLSCTDSISYRVIGRFSEQYRVFPRIYIKQIKNMSPNCFHIVPVLNNAVIHWVAQLENALEFFL